MQKKWTGDIRGVTGEVHSAEGMTEDNCTWLKE